MTDSLIETYINGLYRPVSEELGKFRERAETDGVPVILKSTEMFLGGLLCMKKPGHILEIGAAVGYSAAFFAEKEKNCKIISLESDKERCEAAMKNLAGLNLSERIRVICGDAEEVTRERLVGYKFDFVFIDAAKSRYRRFFDASLTVCEPGSVIVSDNVLLKGKTASDEYDPSGRHKTSVGKMREYIDYISNLSYADTSVLSVGDGLAVTVLDSL